MFSTRENRCHRFQANIFNKSKCKNCFQTVDSHKLSEADLYQSKPVQVGWLLLAPEGIDFSNPGHRKRKWQRRYFVLYEHGLLRFSLDETADTLPQGSVNMTQCCEVLDASSQTGFQNCLRLCFTDRDFYIKTENTDGFRISRWQENLIVYPKAAKSNQRKKRKDIDLIQQTDELQTSSSSTVRRSSSSGSSFNSSIIRRGSLNSSNISGGRASQAVSDALSTSKGSTVSACRVKGSGSIVTGEKGRAGSLVSPVEGVSLISSEKKLEEESPNGEVTVSSSSDAPSLNSVLGSSLSPSLDPFSGCSGTDGTKNRLGIESGYSSLEKTSPLVGDAQSHTDSRCDFASVCSPASLPFMFPTSKSSCSSDFPLPTSNSTQFSGDPEDVVCSSWDRKGLESIDERHSSMTHTSRTHTFRHNAHQARSSGRKAHRLFGNQHRRSQVSEQQESSCLTLDAEPSTSTEQNDKTAVSTPQVLSPNYDIPDLPRPSTSCSFRSKSLERTLDHTPTPDLLNFKKGWMSRLGEDGKWRKHWFVLTDQTLRFYRDSVAEEAADVDGEINLSTCYDVTDYPVQRNYGFQIHTKDGVFTLCAMTYGIRRNWVQAVMKNIRPTVAPDVTCSVPQKAIGAHTRTGFSSQYNTLPQEEEKRSRIRDRRKEGRYKTFDWAELSCKQNKEELSSDLSRREWNHNCEHRVPPAPASSPEGPVVCFQSEALEKECPQKTRLYQSLKNMSTNAPSHSTMVVTNHTSPGSISPDSLEVDSASVRVYCDNPGDRLVNRPKKEKKLQVDRPTSPMLVNLSSSSVQTEWQWEVELQSLHRELKAEHETSQTKERESKLCESRLQAELNNTQDSLRKAELRIQEAETLLKEREEVLEDLQGRLEEVTGCLKTTEDAQALKEVRLQRHLRLLQESQERERRSFSDSLDQSEQRLKELEERLRLKEAELHKRPTGEVTDELVQRCQELQNQLEESDGEVGRLQARLHTEETLYYDMEHDYERACEEIQGLRGALQDCERVCEERFQTQLERKQQELERKESELQEVLVKMAVLGSSLEETERRLKESQTSPPELNASFETMIEPQRMFEVSNVRQKMIRKNGSETQPITPGEESDRVISVIQALELKLCDTEDRLRELTMHLQQQKLNTGPHTLNDSCCAHPSIQNLDGLLFVNALQSCTGALNSLQGKAVFGENPGSSQTLNMTSGVLSLEALVIQRMASALEHPSTELLSRLSDLRVHVLRMSQGGSDCRAVESSYSQIFLYLQEQDQTNSTLTENEVQRLCVKAEMAYLIHTLHMHSSQEQKGSGPFNVLPWPVLDSSPSGSKKENESKQGSKLADISPSELAPYSEQMEELAANLLLEDSEVQLAYRKNLAAELRAQAHSLQDLSIHLQSKLKETDMTGEFPASVLKVAMCQAALAYMACRVRSAMQQEMSALRKQREQAEYEARAVCRSMEVLLQEQTELYEEKLREGRVVVEKVEQGHVSAEVNAQLRVDEAERLQAEFEEKLQELQKIHEEEMSRLHKYYIQNMPTAPPLSLQEDNGELEQVSVTALQGRIRELQSEITFLKEELSKRDAFQLDLESVKATYEHAFSIMEESHQRVIDEIQRQHQREVERLTEERERVLQEETNATIAAIEAMRKAHKEEMDKTHRAMQNGANVDIRQLHSQYNEELESLHRELEVLSEQYSQKCLENTHLTQTMEAEREALGITQRENQELRAHNRELNECLGAELSLMHSRINGEVKPTQSSQEKDVYQLEVNLRVKESEIKRLKQEITSLKLELQAANTHFKELQLELSALGVKTQNDFTKLRMGPARKQSLKYDLMKSRSNTDCSTLTQAVGSKSLKDGLTVLERMKLFELTGTQKT